MKFATAKEHRDFFHKHNWIEFEDFITPDQLILIHQTLDQVLSERLNVSPERLRLLSSEQFFLQGRDVWRSNLSLKKFVMQMCFAETASELFEKKSLRLGYDQFFPASYPLSSFSKRASQFYSHFLEQTLSLKDVSCVQEVVGGLILGLGGKQEEASEETVPSGIDVFPSRPGSVIFFKPNVPINWSNLYTHIGQSFYMIVYTQTVAHYQLQPQDPHTHALKRLGYVFNDKLNDKLHPIVYR